MASVRAGRQFARFSVVGLASTAVDVGVLWVLMGAGWLLPAANVASYVAGGAVNFALNRRVTFPDAHGAFAARLGRFALVSVVGLALNTGVTALLAPLLGVTLAKLLATAASLVWNFLAQRAWTFRPSTGGS